MNNKIIGITGKAGAGKDTMRRYIQDSNKSTVAYSFASPVYAMLETLLGGDMPPKDKYGHYDKNVVIKPLGVNLRYLLQTLGTDWGRNMVNLQIWIHKAEKWYKEVAKTDGRRSRRSSKDAIIVFSDIRFNNEAEWVIGLGGDVYEVCRANAERLQPHSSEAGIESTYVKARIYNDSDIEVFQNNISNIVLA